MKTFALFFVSAAVAGCAASGVVSTGPDSYMIAKSEWGFTSGAVHKARLMNEASEYCQGLGKQVLVTDSKANDVAFGKTPAAEVYFRCIIPSGAGATQQSPKRN